MLSKVLNAPLKKANNFGIVLGKNITLVKNKFWKIKLLQQFQSCFSCYNFFFPLFPSTTLFYIIIFLLVIFFTSAAAYKIMLLQFGSAVLWMSHFSNLRLLSPKKEKKWLKTMTWNLVSFTLCKSYSFFCPIIYQVLKNDRQLCK